MKLKIQILTARLFVRNQGDGEQLDDFRSFARKYMAEQSDKFREQCVEHSLNFCTPESVIALLETNNSAIFRQSVEDLLAVNKPMEAGAMF